MISMILFGHLHTSVSFMFLNSHPICLSIKRFYYFGDWEMRSVMWFFLQHEPYLFLITMAYFVLFLSHINSEIMYFELLFVQLRNVVSYH